VRLGSVRGAPFEEREDTVDDHPTPSGPRRLLILDDEDNIRATLDAYFTALGYTVETAATVPEALAKVQGGSQVVLADIRLPGPSGLDFLQEARRRFPALGVLLLTGYPTLETLIDARQWAATAYFRKPVNLVDVAARLRALLGEAPAEAATHPATRTPAGERARPMETGAGRQSAGGRIVDTAKEGSCPGCR
jgi:DNA-binding response OmpR family regulator